MTFITPWVLWLLFLVPLLGGLYLVLQQRRKSYAVRFTNSSYSRRWRPDAPAGGATLPQSCS